MFWRTFLIAETSPIGITGEPGQSVKRGKCGRALILQLTPDPFQGRYAQAHLCPIMNFIAQFRKIIRRPIFRWSPAEVPFNNLQALADVDFCFVFGHNRLPLT